MTIQMSKTKRILFYIALILTNVATMGDMVITPIVNTFYELFPDNVAGVNFIITGPAIFVVIASMLTPYILKFMKKKTLLLLACFVFAVFSLGGIAVVSVPYIILARCLCSISYSIVQVVAIDIIAEVFVNEEKRASFMGIYNAGMTAVGSVMGIVAGNLAVSGWKNAYHTYLLAIPMVLMVLFFVPSIESEAGETQETETAGEKVPMGPRFWIMLGEFLLLDICYTPVMYMASVYIAENHLGNEALAGLSASVATISGALCSLAFGFLYGKLHARTSIIGYVLMALSLVGLFFFKNPAVYLIICALAGIGYNALFSYIFVQTPVIVAPQNVSRAIAIINACVGLAMFVATYLTTGIMELAGGSITTTFLILGAVSGVCCLVDLLNTSKMKA